jgi:arsenate reductase
MSETIIYGIKACDTMKKAVKWLDEKNIEARFHDYKKLGADEAVLQEAISQHGWETVINRRGTTWRKLPDDVKAAMDEAGAISAALDNPSLVKRPLLAYQGKTYLGFSEELYAEIF